MIIAVSSQYWLFTIGVHSRRQPRLLVQGVRISRVRILERLGLHEGDGGKIAVGDGREQQAEIVLVVGLVGLANGASGRKVMRVCRLG